MHDDYRIYGEISRKIENLTFVDNTVDNGIRADTKQCNNPFRTKGKRNVQKGLFRYSNQIYLKRAEYLDLIAY